MKIKQLALIGLAVAVLSACSSSGSSFNSTSSLNTVPDSVKQQVKQAKQYILSDDNYTFDGNSYWGDEAVDLSGYQNGLTTVNANTSNGSGKIKIYQQPYSVVIGNGIGTFEIDAYIGLKTESGAIPSSGKAHYSGAAFSKDQNGALSYLVNFDNRTGQGRISGIDNAGEIRLHNGTISGTGISANATSDYAGNGHYELGFFGPKAEEIAGKVEGLNSGVGEIGFGGTRGEIYH